MLRENEISPVNRGHHSGLPGIFVLPGGGQMAARRPLDVKPVSRDNGPREFQVLHVVDLLLQDGPGEVFILDIFCKASRISARYRQRCTWAER